MLAPFSMRQINYNSHSPYKFMEVTINKQTKSKDDPRIKLQQQ